MFGPMPILFPLHHSIYIVGRSNLSHFLRNSTGPVSPSEQPDRPGFRVNFSRWGPGGLDLKLHPIRAVLKLPKTRPIRVSSGFDYLKTDQMFGPMPLLPSIVFATTTSVSGRGRLRLGCSRCREGGSVRVWRRGRAEIS